MNKLLIDNWTLQEIAFLLKEGVDDETADKIIYGSRKKSKTIKVPHSAIKLESFFKLLTEIITSEQLIVDIEFQHVWKKDVKPLDFLHEKELISTINFEKSEYFVNFRESLVENFNLPKDLEKKHKAIVAYWNKHQKSKDDFLSPLIWGTAGNITRGSINDLSYSPHPIRAAFLQCTPFSNKKLVASEEVINIIKQKRVEVIKRAYENSNFNIGMININPIIIEIIESSSSINNMVTVALQMRKEYQKFRKFIAKYQTALNDGSIKELITLNDVINEVSDKILNKGEYHKYGEFELSFGFGKIKKKFDLHKFGKSKIGARVSIEKLILKKNSEGTIDKLLDFFDEKNYKLRSEIKDYFIDKLN